MITQNTFFKCKRLVESQFPGIKEDKEVFKFAVQYEVFRATVCYPQAITPKQMCEHIALAGFTRKDGTKPTPEEIFNYSPSGELSKIFDWYEDACALIGPPKGFQTVTE